MSEHVSSVKRYVGDYGGGLPDVMSPGLHDIAIDSCSGRFWVWDGQRWTMASNVTGIEVYLGSGKTLREMISNAEPQIEGVQLYTGDSDLIPVEMQGGENDLVIMHSLGNPPSFLACYYALSADDSDDKRLLAVPKTDEVISTSDGYWTTWRKFGCAVSNGPCVISLLTMNATKGLWQAPVPNYKFSMEFTSSDVAKGKLSVTTDIAPKGIVSPDGVFYSIGADQTPEEGVYVLDLSGIDITEGTWTAQC